MSVPIPGRKPPLPEIMGGGYDMIPLPSITGGAAGPATSGGIGTQGNIDGPSISTVFGNKNSFATNAVYVLGALIGIYLWTRKRK